jgi:hypothetical protein
MSGLQSCGCGDEDCFMGNKIWLSDEGGVERVNLIWGHHKNSTRTSKPIPAIKLPVGGSLTRVLQWWIKVGFFRLKSGTMVSDDEVTTKYTIVFFAGVLCVICAALCRNRIINTAGQSTSHHSLLRPNHQPSLVKQAMAS